MGLEENNSLFKYAENPVIPLASLVLLEFIERPSDTVEPMTDLLINTYWLVPEMPTE